MQSQNQITNIKQVFTQVGISSEEVSLAKDVLLNKHKDHSLFVCEGLWAVDKLIQKNFKVVCFLVCDSLLEDGASSASDLEKIAKMAHFAQKSCLISEKACKKISDRDGYDRVFIIAVQPKLSLKDLSFLAKKEEVMGIVMDGLEQPGNIGAILRSFDAAGGDFAIITNKIARLTNSRLVRSSLGASFMLPVVETDIAEAQKWLAENGFRCLVTDLQAKKSFKSADYSGKIAIIAGNEHTGISASWRSVPGAESIIIPMLGSCESLNVGFASTLVAYEAGLKKFGNKK